MKKTLLIIPAIALLVACGGGNANQNNGTATDTAAIVETPQCDVSTDTEQPENQKPSAILAEMQKDKRISDTARRFFEAIHFQDPAELDDKSGCYVWKNGCSATFKNGESYDFRVYNKWDGTQLGLMAKYNAQYGSDEGEYYKMPETTIWHYDGTKAEKINSTIPMPAIEEFRAWQEGDHSLKKNRYHLNLDENFIQYVAQSSVKDDEEEYENPGLYLSYTWNGEKFVNQYKYDEYVAFKIWEKLKPRFEKEFGLNTMPIVENNSIYVEQGEQQVHVRRIHYFVNETDLNWQGYTVYVISDDCTITNENREGTYTIEEYFSTVQETGCYLRKSLNGIQPELQEYEKSETLHPVIEGDILKILDTGNDNNIVATFKFQNGQFVKQ